MYCGWPHCMNPHCVCLKEFLDMQNYQVFAVRDSAAGFYNRPWFARSRGEALRMFTDEVNRVDANNPLNAHPRDFELWYIGNWSDDTGMLECVKLDRVALGVDVRLTE